MQWTLTMAVSESMQRFEQCNGQAVSGQSADETEESGEFTVTKIRQRIKIELDAHEVNPKGGTDEIWALVDMEFYDPDQLDTFQIDPPKRKQKWLKFNTESELSDYVRRDTGEPLTMPPYSLTPMQSSKIKQDTQQAISKVTEEYRRFRVKAEMARKQADTQIRELQSANVETAKRRIEGQEVVRPTSAPVHVIRYPLTCSRPRRKNFR